MKVLKELCWNGNNNYSVRLSHPEYGSLVVRTYDGERDRAVSIKCLDAIEYNWSVKRQNVRFI